MNAKENEILFLVEENEDGSFSARAASHSIYTEAASLDELKIDIMDAITCHFDDEANIPSIIRLHIVKDEVLFYAKTAA